MANKKLYDNAELTVFFELRKNALIEYIYRRIAKLLNDSASKVILQLAGTRLVNTELPLFAVKKIDAIEAAIDAEVTDLIKRGYNAAYSLSGLKDDGIDNLVFTGRKTELSDNAYIPFKDLMMPKDYSGGSTRALKEFVAERERNFSLSKNVWKVSRTHTSLIKTSLRMGLLDGRPAAAIAKDVVEYTYKPKKEIELRGHGQGVYRDPKKNAMRMVRTEVNRAYRKADANRWATKWYVAGIEIKRSHNHNDCDVCDALIGKYPKDYVFTGNHPQCLCYATAILVPRETQLAMTAYQITGEGTKPEYEHFYIRDIPDKAKQWYAANIAQMRGWKNLPNVLTDNAKYFGLAA